MTETTIQRADSSRTIRLERRTVPMGRIATLHPPAQRPDCPGAFNMDLTPFFDGPEHIDQIVERVLAHGGSPVRIGEAGPGSLHTGHEVGLTYDVLTRDAVAEAVPEVVFLHDNPASACLRLALGDDDVVPLEGERGLNINITSGEHVHEWHVGGPDLLYTTVTGLQVPAPDYGIPAEQVVYVDHLGRPLGDATELTADDVRDEFGIARVHPDTPGAFVWHDGVRKHATLVERGRCLVAPGLTPHGVNAVPPGFTRITLIMSWVAREDAERSGTDSDEYGVERETELANYLYGETGHSGQVRNARLM